MAMAKAMAKAMAMAMAKAMAKVKAKGIAKAQLLTLPSAPHYPSHYTHSTFPPMLFN